MKFVAIILTSSFLSSCAYYAGYGVTSYPVYSNTHTYYTSPSYYNTYKEVYASINCENGLNQYEVLRIYPNRDGRPFNLKYDHYY